MSEDARCGGCDCIPNEDGCECRDVSCCGCGVREKIYNMENELRETGDWANIPFHDKLDHFYCLRCFDGIDMIEEDM
jgi:hypothetical protein